MMDKPHAVLLNFTGNSYHWGCFGTAYEVWQTLLERGYTVDTVEVQDTHGIGPTPAMSNDFVDPDFFARFEQQNPRIVRVMRHADVVVVNGEGTLHRGSNGAVNLLYMMFAAKLFLDKPVHLVNHSFYPSGGMEPCPLDEVYASVAAVLDKVVPREPGSAAVLQRLGIGFQQGFDCLPRFLDRHGLVHSSASSPGDGILVTGGVLLQDADIDAMTRALEPFAQAGQAIRFITGARNAPAFEDKRHYELLKAALPGLELVDAQSMTQWVKAIGSSACLVSGRYHHSVAAASLGVPFIAVSSNTPKIEATMHMLDGPQVIASLDDDNVQRIEDFIGRALHGEAALVTEPSIRNAIALAENNFAGL
jgi:polysaccharide pyruvyl transferase WcaK-like protein